MADVFISYSRKHRDTVVRLSDALREFSLETWFDIEVRAGSIFADAIMSQLSAAKCVLVLWTKDALRKGPRGWVYSEADWARQHGKLVQAQLEAVALHPPFFSSVAPPIDLSSFKDARTAASTLRSRLPDLLERIGQLTNRPGLGKFVSARSSDADLLRWAAQYPRDPIVGSQSAIFVDAKSRIEAGRQSEVARIRQRQNLAAELRALARATQTAPVVAFPVTAPDARIEMHLYERDLASAERPSESLFDATALRAIVCGDPSLDPAEQSCLAMIAGGHFFIVDAGSGATSFLNRHGIPLERLNAVLLTQAGLTQIADLSSLFGESTRGREDALLPVYGPDDTQGLVDGLNAAGGFDGYGRGLQAWGPSPEPGRSVIVFEADGLIVSAFTTQEDAISGRVGYRFDYRGRSIVVGGDGQVISSAAAANADVVFRGATTQRVTQLHGGASDAQVAAHAQAANAGLVVLTGTENEIAAQMQVAEARAAGFTDVVAGRIGVLVELPLHNSDIKVGPVEGGVATGSANVASS